MDWYLDYIYQYRIFSFSIDYTLLNRFYFENTDQRANQQTYTDVIRFFDERDQTVINETNPVHPAKISVSS